MMMEGHKLSVIATNGDDSISGLQYHPSYPFLTPFKIEDSTRFGLSEYCFMFYMVDLYTVCLSVNFFEMRKILRACYVADYQHHYLKKFLGKIALISEWLGDVNEMVMEHARQGNEWVLLLLRRNFSNLATEAEVIVRKHWFSHSNSDITLTYEIYLEGYKSFKRKMLDANNVTADEYLYLLNCLPFKNSDFPKEYNNKLKEAYRRYSNMLYEEYLLVGGDSSELHWDPNTSP